MNENLRPEPLRPLTLGEILDRTAQLYRGNFLCFAGVAAVPTVVILVVMIPALAVFLIPGMAAAKHGGPPGSGAVTALIAVVAAVAFVVALAAAVISQAALIRMAIGANVGQKLRIREALKSVRPQFWRYLGVLFLQGIFVGLIPGVIAGIAVTVTFLLARLAGGGIASNAVAGFVTFLIVAAAGVVIVMRALSYSLAMPACIAEEKPAWESLRRAKKLSKGARWRIFLMFLLVWALTMVVSMMGYIPLMVLTVVASAMGKGGLAATILVAAGGIIDLLVNFAVQALIPPVYMTALVLFYYDQRIRTEGYDIEW
ncbi:MAG: hypothetical protein WBE38_20680, partial [Terracidiphilus sp.]